MVLGPAALFFAAFCVPSMAFATLALRDFLRRDAPGDRAARLRRARIWMLLAAALPLLLVVLTLLATGGAPFTTTGGFVFVGWGVVAGALGPLGVHLFRRAAGDPRRRLRKAAETVPLVLIMLDLVLVYNAAVQLPA